MGAIQIVEYDQADPLGVLELNLLSLGYPLNPDVVALIRKLDLRVAPYMALYAIVDGVVAGQVGVDRLPVVTLDGDDEVGGVWAVCTHLAFSRLGIARVLMEEAHRRMRQAGLRYSTLGTARHRGAYDLYRQLGYEPLFHASACFAYRQAASLTDRLSAEPAGAEGLPLTEVLFQGAAQGRLGFARRHPRFIAMMVETGDMHLNEIWLLRRGRALAGYAMANVIEGVLVVSHLLLLPGVEAAEAVSALAQAMPCSYLRVRVDDPQVGINLARHGFPQPRRDWSVFMVKPLGENARIEEFKRQVGIGSERFMISWIDVT